MYPELFSIGPITLYSYGVLLAASYLLGLWLAMRRAKQWGLDPKRVLDLGIYIIIAALIGAKLLLLVVDFDQFSASPQDLLSLARSGGVFYGGLILAVVVAFWYIARHRLPFWTTCDVFAPGIALGHVTGRLGCLAAGLLLRQADRRPVGDHVHQPAGRGECRHAARHSAASDPDLRSGRGAADPGAPARHRAARPSVRRAARSGPYMFLYAISRYIIEIYRGDPRGEVFGCLDVAVHLAGARAAQPRDAGLAVAHARRRRPQEMQRAAANVPRREPVDRPTRVRCARSRPGRFRRAAARPLSGVGARRPFAIADPETDRRRPRHASIAASAQAPTWPMREGDRVSVDLPDVEPATTAAEALPLEILYQDADLAVLNKPAGMVVHPGAGHASGTLVNALLHHIPDLSGIGGELRPGIVHRLDRGHVGRDGGREERRGAPGARAAVPGPRGREGVHRARLGRRPGRATHRRGDRPRSGEPAEDVGPGQACARARSPASPARITCRASRSARWRFTPAARIRFACTSAPSATRSSATRCTAACIAACRATSARVQRLERPFLHAARLVFTHPRDGRRMEFIAPLPDDLLAVLEDLPGWKDDDDE